ncbi:hypothetical protein KM043_009198 [Ampulex compressa]|nr:hypothetical protein KM043_009198 [Ampulex compressa]
MRFRVSKLGEEPSQCAARQARLPLARGRRMWPPNNGSCRLDGTDRTVRWAEEGARRSRADPRDVVRDTESFPPRVERVFLAVLFSPLSSVRRLEGRARLPALASLPREGCSLGGPGGFVSGEMRPLPRTEPAPAVHPQPPPSRRGPGKGAEARALSQYAAIIFPHEWAAASVVPGWYYGGTSAVFSLLSPLPPSLRPSSPASSHPFDATAFLALLSREIPRSRLQAAGILRTAPRRPRDEARFYEENITEGQRERREVTDHWNGSSDARMHARFSKARITLGFMKGIRRKNEEGRIRRRRCPPGSHHARLPSLEFESRVLSEIRAASTAVLLPWKTPKLGGGE